MIQQMQTHPFPPVYNESSRILILGSFPSTASREAGFYYAHPRNRFWQVIAAVTGEGVPQTIEQKTALLLRRRIALWDSVAGCNITGSSDSSIRQASPNDIPGLVAKTQIKRIFCNGKTAYACYAKAGFPNDLPTAEPLPSTSPANAAWSLERLIEAWRVIMDSVSAD